MGDSGTVPVQQEIPLIHSEVPSGKRLWVNEFSFSFFLNSFIEVYFPYHLLSSFNHSFSLAGRVQELKVI